MLANIGKYSICHTKSTKIKTDKATTAKNLGIFPSFDGKMKMKKVIDQENVKNAAHKKFILTFLFFAVE